MMNKDDIKNKAECAANTVKESAESLMNNPKGEMIASCKDWTNYIKTHPLQSVLFGLIGYFAIKGIIK